MNKQNAILLVFLLLAAMYLAYLLYNSSISNISSSREHYVEPGYPSDYDARLNVMKVFEAVLKRKPSIEEISKYASISNEQDLLARLMLDFSETYVNEESREYPDAATSISDAPPSMSHPVPTLQTVSEPQPIQRVLTPADIESIRRILENIESQIASIRTFVEIKK